MKITLEFIGLFLFDNSFDQQKRVAVIHANRDASHGGHLLRRHQAFFSVLGDEEPLIVGWPHDDNRYDLTGNISFAVAGAIDPQKWSLPRLLSGCPEFRMVDGFFDQPRENETHAVIDLRAGTFCSWRFVDEDGEEGAINTRVTFDVPSFTMLGDGGRRIEFHADGEIRFQNTELVPTDDLTDGLWYYNATGNSCAPEPDDTGIEPECDPPDVKPFTLGCSNSQWP